MEKEKVLEKSRASKSDEGKEYLRINAYRYGYLPSLLTAGLFVGFAYPMFDYPLIFISWLGAISLSTAVGEFFARYRFTGKRIFLAASICSAVAIIGFFVLFVFLHQ